jgi:hypothetical protein
VEFNIELILGIAPISGRPYQMPANELVELKNQLNELLKKGLIWPIVPLLGVVLLSL